MKAVLFFPCQARSITAANNKNRNTIMALYYRIDISKHYNLVGIEHELCHTLFMRIFVLSLLLCCPVLAQWPDSSESNLAICTSAGEQAITKIIATDDGGCYVSWLDNRSGGYDVYMQRLDASGNALWQENGILIADRNYSWTMDFGLDIDSAGNAVVVYRKNMLGGDGIVVSSVSPKGNVRWSKTLQGGGSFVASPVITASNDDVVVGWINENVSDFQRLNSNGDFMWEDSSSIDDPLGGTLSVADIQPSLEGGVIASFVQYTSFTGTKLLKAQFINVDGTQVWLQLAEVMQDNSLQIGAYPDFVHDNAGGAFFTWYGVNPLQCYAMHVSSDGTPWSAGQVQVASSFSGTQRVSPVGVCDGDDFVVFFRSQDNSQNNDGIGAQRLSQDGVRLWGGEGRTIKPTSSSPQYGSFAAAKTDAGVALFYGSSASFGSDIVQGVSLDGKGNMQWSPEFVSVASTPSSKSRMVAGTTSDGVILAWQDDRNGSNDIYAQRVNSDGSLGVASSCDGDVDGDGNVGVTDVLAVIGTWGPCENCTTDIDGDGIVGVNDLLAIIGQWGAC